MDVIFNDFSLDGQFASIEEFEEYFVKTFRSAVACDCVKEDSFL